MASSFKFLLLGVVVLGLGVGAAFAAGTAYGRVSAPTASPAAAASQSRAGGTASAPSTELPADMTRGGAGMLAITGGRPAAMGTVESVADGTVTVKTQSGTTSVKIDEKTTIRKTVDGTPDDLKPGTTVVVTGETGGDGTVAATSIAISAADAVQPARQQGGRGSGR